MDVQDKKVGQYKDLDNHERNWVCYTHRRASWLSHDEHPIASLPFCFTAPLRNLSSFHRRSILIGIHTQEAPYALALAIHFYPETAGCSSTTSDLACPEYLNTVGCVCDRNEVVGVRDERE